MAVTPNIRVTEGAVEAAITSDSADIRATQFTAKAAINFPTDSMRTTQLTAKATITPETDSQVTQLAVLAAVRGRVENHKIRAWTFSLDGHDFYVLRLDDTESLVMDMSTGQWAKWSSPEEDFWRAWNGMNWLGMSRDTFLSGAQSQIVAGDDTYGLLWTIDPDLGYDHNPRYGEDGDPHAFDRTVIGGVAVRLRETQKVGAAYLVASVGSPQITGAGITLRTSDDYGKTWTSHGTVTITPSDYSQELVWRSIGLMKAPGRIFELSDSGATVRIDSLDIR